VSAGSAVSAGNAEGVSELSPGCRLCGTLGTHVNTRTALKERNRTGSLAELSSSSNEEGGFMTCVRTESFALSELCAAFVIDTQGSAKPAPWAKFAHAFGAPSASGDPDEPAASGTSGDHATDSAVAERHALPHLLTPNLL